MIVPMKKATILFETKDAEATVKYLRTLGVLQVEHQNPPGGQGYIRASGKSGLN